MGEHSYDRAVLLEACDIGDVEEIEIDQPSKEQKVGRDHTPLNSPLPKKMKSSGIEESTGEAILHAVQALTKKMEEQTELLKRFEKRIEANTAATKENKEEIIRAHNEIRELQAQNLSLKRACEEQARYKRRWNPKADWSSRERGRRRERGSYRDSNKSGAFICGAIEGHGGYGSSSGQKDECGHL